MSSAARRVLDEALALPEADREEIARALSDSLSPESVELGAAWRSEIVGRLDAIERGDAELIGWEELEARLRRRGLG